MTPEIKDYATWEEAYRWLAKHGWGLDQINQQKVLWDAANPPSKVETVTKSTVKTTKPIVVATE